jgi:acylpyruvate hydrolase
MQWRKALVFLVLCFLSVARNTYATRLVTYSVYNETRAGAIEGTYVVDLQRAYAFYLFNALRADPAVDESLVPPTLQGILEGGDATMKALEKTLEFVRQVLGSPVEVDRLTAAGVLKELKRVRLQTPLQRPPQILAIGLNYRSHAAEIGRRIPEYLEVFSKVCLPIGPEESIRIPQLVKQPDYEGELAVVIGKPARNVLKEKALEFVAGYMIFNDVTARDIQLRTSQWVLGKSVDSFAVAGPYLVLKEEIKNPQNLELKTSIGSEILQQASTSDMVFPITEIIAEISRFLTLQPGTIITTGTPAGVGVARTPPRWLRNGDTVRVEIEGLGTLENPVLQD